MADEIRILALFGGVARLGSERANLEALTALRHGGSSVRLLMSDARWAKEIRQDAAARGFEVIPCPYLRLPRPERRHSPLLTYPTIIARASWILLREMRRFRPTHIYASSQMFVLNFLPTLAFTSTPLIYRCGDKPIIHSWLFQMVRHFIYRRTCRIVPVSKCIANLLGETGVKPDQIAVIYARPPSRLVKETVLTGKKGKFTFAFVGQINKTKRPHRLIEAFGEVLDSHPNARLVIAGRISDWEGDSWARALRDGVQIHPKLAGSVEFCGFVEDVQKMLTMCQVVVIPTVIEEPLANVAMEAKLAGLPSIIFPSGGLPEVVEHGIDGYICADGTVAALQAAMIWYLEDQSAAELQGLAARRSLHKLGIDDFVARWMSVVGQIDLKCVA